jgi:hypothetical protein
MQIALMLVVVTSVAAGGLIAMYWFDFGVALSLWA